MLFPVFCFSLVVTEDDIKSRIIENQKTEKSDMKSVAPGEKKDVLQVLSQPGMDAQEIPVKPQLFKPFEKRPVTPIDKEFRQRMLNALWETPLGQMFYYYLFAEIAPIEVPSLARQFVRRIYSASSQVASRLSAIELLITDLYSREKMTDDATKRLVLLQSDIFQYNENGNARTKNRAVKQAALFMLFSIPFGFPRVRQRIKDLFRYITPKFLLSEKKGPDKKPPAWFSLDMLKSYEPGKAVKFFFTTFGPYSMSYFFYMEWLSAYMGKNLIDKSLLNGLEDIIKALQL